MNGAEARAYLLTLPGAREDFPFGPEVAVMKVGGRMFATLARGPVPRSHASDTARRDREKPSVRGSEASGYQMNLKCDPDEAEMLRDLFHAVIPGYHMNKRHWNTVLLDGSIPRGEIERMIDNSYDLVIAGLAARERRALALQTGRAG